MVSIDVLSNVGPLSRGVPQGIGIRSPSVLTLFMAPLTDIQEAWEAFLIIANDTKIYFWT